MLSHLPSWALKALICALSLVLVPLSRIGMVLLVEQCSRDERQEP